MVATRYKTLCTRDSASLSYNKKRIAAEYNWCNLYLSAITQAESWNNRELWRNRAFSPISRHKQSKKSPLYSRDVTNSTPLFGCTYRATRYITPDGRWGVGNAIQDASLSSSRDKKGRSPRAADVSRNELIPLLCGYAASFIWCHLVSGK